MYENTFQWTNGASAFMRMYNMDINNEPMFDKGRKMAMLECGYVVRREYMVSPGSALSR